MKFQNNIWTMDGRYLENRFLGHNSSTDCPISAKFCTMKQNGRTCRQRLHDKNCKFLKSKMVDSCYFENLKSPYLSKHRSISMQFDRIQQIFDPMTDGKWNITDHATFGVAHMLCHMTLSWGSKITTCMKFLTPICLFTVPLLCVYDDD